MQHTFMQELANGRQQYLELSKEANLSDVSSCPMTDDDEFLLITFSTLDTSTAFEAPNFLAIVSRQMKLSITKLIKFTFVVVVFVVVVAMASSSSSQALTYLNSQSTWPADWLTSLVLGTTTDTSLDG